LQPTPKDMNETMLGAVLPGNSTVELKDFPIPEPRHGQVLVKTKSSTICGSDIRAIYREHLGRGPERYQNKIAGHEPCGQIVAEGPGLKRFKKGDRVIVYHISGCGMCNDCRRGYMISCASPFRAAVTWNRPSAPHQVMRWPGSVSASNIRSADPLIVISWTIESGIFIGFRTSPLLMFASMCFSPRRTF